MSLDRGALGMAVLVEFVLFVLAVFGGPHGALGAWPWMLQVPGILLIYAIPGQSFFPWRVAAGVCVQIAVWYVVFLLLRRRRRAGAA